MNTGKGAEGETILYIGTSSGEEEDEEHTTCVPTTS